MRRYRATVYHLSSVAACVDGDSATRRFIVEEDAFSPENFKGKIRDRYIHDVDAEVSFGPISDVTVSRR